MIIGTNPQGDTVVMYDDDTILNFKFWDCDCAHLFVRPTTHHHCNECGADRDDSPISQEVDVQQLFYAHSL